ncbi:MAG: hypothetical protein AB8B65_13935 [Kordia sp.]|uniref:hypothetical protein n=1 Tax=Kordia sp. TaxID=1965332 RepID=UPI00385F30EA
MNLISLEIKENFLIRLYFGVVTDFYFAGVKRAYLDFSRTLHLKNETKLQREITRKETEYYLVKKLKEFISKDLSNQNEFDTEHRKIVLGLKNKWKKLSIGQSQKWVNMTLKYWLLFGNKRIPSIEKNAIYFHIPIDSIIQKSMFPNMKHNAWSKMKDYDLVYMEYQKKFRTNSNEIPILAEFNMFNESK